MSSGSWEERRPWKWTKRRPAARPRRGSDADRARRRTRAVPSSGRGSARLRRGRRRCGPASARQLAVEGPRDLAARLGLAARARRPSRAAARRRRRASPARTAARPRPGSGAARRRCEPGSLASGAAHGRASPSRGVAEPTAAWRDDAGSTRMRASARAISVTGMVRPGLLAEHEVEQVLVDLAVQQPRGDA